MSGAASPSGSVSAADPVLDGAPARPADGRPNVAGAADRSPDRQAEIIDLQSEVALLRRRLQREEEARRLAEQVAAAGTDEILRRQREVMLLCRVAVAANEAVSMASAAEEALSLVARHLDWPAATLYLRTEPGPLRPTGLWYAASENCWRALAGAVASRLEVPTGSLPGSVAGTGAPVWLEHLDTRGSWLRDEHDRELGVSSAFAVPVWAGREVIGVVTLFHHEHVPVDAAAMELVEQVVTQLGAAARRLPSGAADPATHDLPAGGPAVPLLANLAHEIRTPLNGLIGNLELLGERASEPECRDLAALALQCALDAHQVFEQWLGADGLAPRPDGPTAG